MSKLGDMNIPIYFITSHYDTVVPSIKTENIYKKYKG
jgi:hypothetical protein